ncbi:Myeloid leukemia factor 1 like protein [Argiope bruennichi]|uniref:Myeloid leukemia factor 1 like protein n=1 Tax=Argiope bruennichi TaxID=94029 RepID=A0A8T0EE47_ARGBR|nr:Myeloid leukemia factor 1 like protein [Argiope bruennichi]
MMSPFGLFGGGNRRAAIDNRDNRSHGNMLMPFGFGGSLFQIWDAFLKILGNQMSNDPNCHSFTSSSVMTYTTDETGRPQVYQASSPPKTHLGGVKETIHSVQDSRTGLQKMAIGHHLNEKGHVVEKKKNRYTGDEEENEEYINLEDDEVDHFDKEWQDRAQAFNGRRPMRNMVGYEDYHHPKRTHSQPELLAITDGTSSPEHTGAAKKKTGKHKRKGIFGHKKDHTRPSPYQ